jgi:2-keto-3-deoxy-L-rhamnonate aldolase RhmA
MENANRFRDKIRAGGVCIGTGVCFTDPTVTEALCRVFDFVWIDMEHNALSLEAVQGHIMATKCTQTTPLVRVPWNDPVIIKPVLDIGAAGVIVPMIRTADDVRAAVASCRYPPQGIRGFGPRRASNYGAIEDGEYCRLANETILTIVQIENTDAVRTLDASLAVPGLGGIVLGPADLSASMGFIGKRNHPEVQLTMEEVIRKANQADVLVGIASGEDPDAMIRWIDYGVQWVCMGNDTSLMLRIRARITVQV